MSQVQVEYSLPPGDGSERIAWAWARVPLVPTPAERAAQMARVAAPLRAHDAVRVVHFYVDGDLQDLALETGGCVADSREMARFGRDHPAATRLLEREVSELRPPAWDQVVAERCHVGGEEGQPLVDLLFRVPAVLGEGASSCLDQESFGGPPDVRRTACRSQVQ